MIQRVIDDPVIPLRWGAAQKGMVSGDDLPPEQLNAFWLNARDDAVLHARALLAKGCHKTLPNRLLEPWMWITVLVTATDWLHFFSLRTAPDAEDHFRHLAVLMEDAYYKSEPKFLKAGEWHLPLIREDDEGLSSLMLPKVSAGRCARVSYLTHDGKRDPAADLDLCERLIDNHHMSPLEHPAMALATSERVANFRGWVQLRRLIR
jgi:thymidylate synthase ThyX